MATIKITSKRQATFPSELCGDLGIEPGDQVILEPLEIEGRKVWTIHRVEEDDEWFGSLSKYASSKSHDMDDIRTSIIKRRLS
ncbi:MAG: AbrB/MazE/SpoVT family DNA-binding domain-containing protein [Planctomycetes bacterium]|nr:AbrB/MazE/SpoVT family DNA-binding domain-containing protein [Planctomycetota bacterium]